MDLLSPIELYSIVELTGEAQRGKSRWARLGALPLGLTFWACTIRVEIPRNFWIPLACCAWRTGHEEFLRYILQPLQRLVEKIYNPPKIGGWGYTCVAWNAWKGREISTEDLFREHLPGSLKNTK
ncbi:hypothetical protein BY996DRAFT_6613003 [Phakopsora pachyrhizi]|nr:hypothetical protein BY996DRAFT_6613003 [Phakopsora pachyrhizi]